QNKIIKIRNPESIRPWQHVLDPIYGMLTLTEKMWYDTSFSDDWNFGPNNQRNITVKELVEKFIEIWGRGNYLIKKDKKLKEANYLQLDINKAKNKLNWLPKYEFEESIRMTVEWYKAYYERKENMEKITEFQIEKFMKGE
ncbi:MAG: CDP-glucose 4,6-dehydratase, partial [Thermoplasmata archaeon]